jgi:tRNA(His) 5'-end guanylyltransferase
MPVILRVDGKAFHTLTKGFQKPFDVMIEAAMSEVALKLCADVSGAVFAYRQSDEVSVLIRSNQNLGTQPWFGNNVQKIVSVAASIASTVATRVLTKAALFDARVFVLPEDDVVNYFIWRQQDATRNSIQGLAQSLASHKECFGKDQAALQELCFSRGVNWNDLPTKRKRGVAFYRKTLPEPMGCYPPAPGTTYTAWREDEEPPIFTQDRNFVERFLRVTHAAVL